MKFLIFFAAAAALSLVHCDQECFRAVFEDCVGIPVAQERMTLCEEIQNGAKCVYQKARDCKMPFGRDALDFYFGVHEACAKKDWFDKEKVCFKRAISNSECAEPINEVTKDLKTLVDFIRANKKICNLFESYSNCVQEDVEKNCHGDINSLGYFNNIFRPLRSLSNSVCQHLILPADEKDRRPGNFGMMNVYASLVAIFGSA